MNHLNQSSIFRGYVSIQRGGTWKGKHQQQQKLPWTNLLVSKNLAICQCDLGGAKIPHSRSAWIFPPTRHSAMHGTNRVELHLDWKELWDVCIYIYDIPSKGVKFQPPGLILVVKGPKFQTLGGFRYISICYALHITLRIHTLPENSRFDGPNPIPTIGL